MASEYLLKAGYDIIFAGGGTSACLTAGRLAAADPSLRILVLEAGPHTHGIQEHIQPGRYFQNLLPGAKTIQYTVANPSDHVAGRSIIVPSGRCVGGGSSVNLMMYTRAAASDYDDWETIYENPGWGSKDMIPLLKKSETYQVQPDHPTHGYDGPLKVSHGGIYTNVGKSFLELAAEYDKERGYIEDTNDLYTINAYTRWPKWIDGDSGRRSDVAHHFIYNQDHNKNLHVATGCRVKRVLIEDGRAVGVEFIGSNEKNYTVCANRLVVVSAGAFGSPAILERSGIGSRDVLEAAGIEQVVDLPGVGENYNDHLLMFIPYLARNDANTFDLLQSGDSSEYEKLYRQWQEDGTGHLASNGIDSGIKMRPTAKDLDAIGPDFRYRWKNFFAKDSARDKPVLYIGSLAGCVGDRTGLPLRKYFTIEYFLNYPESTGRVHITSDNVDTAPDFDSGFLSGLADLAIMRWAYKRSREYARRHPLYEGELVSRHPQFPVGSTVAPMENQSPVPISTPDLLYSAEDDEAIDNYIRRKVETTWHSLGTCSMRPRECNGVVDSRLNVYGVQGLKVADLSIAPGNVGANTYSSAAVIGEKAALLISEDLGIKGV